MCLVAVLSLALRTSPEPATVFMLALGVGLIAFRKTIGKAGA